jgi:hypothetical protein
MVSFAVRWECGDFFQRKLPYGLPAYNDIDGSGREWVRAALDSELVEQIYTTPDPIAGNVKRHSTVCWYSIITRFADSQTQDVILGRRANDLWRNHRIGQVFDPFRSSSFLTMEWQQASQIRQP